MENYQNPQVPQQAPVAPAEAQLPQANKKGFDVKKLIPVVAVVVVVAIVIGLFAGGGYKKPLDKYFDIVYEGKASNIKDLLPDEAWEEFAEEFDVDKDELIESLGEGLAELIEEREEEYGKFKKVEYEIVDEEKIEDDDLEEIAEAVADMWDVDEKDITAAYELEVEGTAIYEDEEIEFEETYFSVKVNGKWYLFTSYGSPVAAELVVGLMFAEF